MKIKEINGGVLIEDPRDFNVEQIFDCGQAFRFTKLSEGEYHGVAFSKYLRVKHVDEGVFLWPCSLDDYYLTWENYFDLKTDYAEIKRSISKDFDVLKKATEYGYGIRILKQDPWEIIISFIISANNNIPRIQGSIEKLAMKYGKPFEDASGQVRYAFPEPEALAEADIQDLRACGLGYRDKYVKKTAQMICDAEVSIQSVLDMKLEAAEKELLKLTGVGKKVADCILLFGFSHMSAFPVDTWVKKVIAKYFLSEDSSVKEILDFADKEFAGYGGYVQQYLFYYIREGVG